MQKPPVNLLFVFSDQHRWCDLGCYGNTEVISPHLDAFAANGVRFDQCYTHCPLCVPARGTLMTGLHAMKHRAAANDLPIDTTLESAAHVLNRAGYQSGYIGKWHLAGLPRLQAVPPAERLGFKHWKVRQCSHKYLEPEYYDEEGILHKVDGYEPEVQTDLAMDFISQHQHQGWGLVLSWGPPHDPYDMVPEKYRKHFDSSKLTLRPNVPSHCHHIPEELVERDVIQEWLAGYYSHIMALDEQFGRLVGHLKQLGLWENTLVVYTSDHGDLLGSQGLTLKQLPYEESSHVPLIVGGGLARLRQGSCRELIGLADLFPTLLGALGLAYSGEIDGHDLSALLFDESAKGLEELYLYNPIPCHQGADRGDGSWRALRRGDFTYAMNLDDASDWFLFNNAKDPYQLHNLLGSSPEADAIAQDMRARTLRCVERYDANLPWWEIIPHYGLTEEWNKSQRNFKRPELQP